LAAGLRRWGNDAQRGSTYGGVDEGKVIRKGGRLTSLGMESGGERLFGGGLFIKRRVVEGTC
jgi:hypothetical protein